MELPPSKLLIKGTPTPHRYECSTETSTNYTAPQVHRMNTQIHYKTPLRTKFPNNCGKLQGAVREICPIFCKCLRFSKSGFARFSIFLVEKKNDHPSQQATDRA